VTHETWKDLAGSSYDKLMESKDAALATLAHPNGNVRIAAIHICDSVWHCAKQDEFVRACRQMAAEDPDEVVRAHAIGMYGKAMRLTKDLAASRFLADLVKRGGTSQDLRKASYWALREVQMGLTEEDTIRRTISVLKLGFHKLPMPLSEQDIKSALGSYFSKIDWDSVDVIDWDFVCQYAS
jgi:hypothetical protein